MGANINTVDERLWTSRLKKRGTMEFGIGLEQFALGAFEAIHGYYMYMAYVILRECEQFSRILSQTETV